MPDLIAQGSSPQQRWRRGLPEVDAGRQILLGRQPTSEPDSAVVVDSGDRHEVFVPWAVTWDLSISRRHAKLRILAGDRVEVRRLPDTSNAIYYRGKTCDQFVLVPGEHFVIGQTTFTLARRPGFVDMSPPVVAGADRKAPFTRPPSSQQRLPKLPPPEAALGSADDLEAAVTEWAFDATDLRKRDFQDANSRIGLLSRLPDLVAGSVDDEELLVRVTEVLLRATPAATAVAIVSVGRSTYPPASGLPSPDEESPLAVDEGSEAMRLLHYDTRRLTTEAPEVSSRLVARAVRRRESVLHVWESTRSGAEFTAAENADWAFCVPLRSAACAGWAIYVTGSKTAVSMRRGRENSTDAIADRLGDDVKFAEVVGSLISGIRQAGQLQQQQAAMRRFFAPVVLDAMAGQDAQEWLQPKQCNLSVLFCDLRGFSRTSEEHSDKLLMLLEQVSAALGIMTRHILDTGGVIGDFHGDAAMGFWGWPLPMGTRGEASRNGAVAAAKAAQSIRHDFAYGNSPFRCGIGIASGSAVAGRIGTVDQVKVTAFGPVVNLASRLEGLTKAFGVEVLMDQQSADLLQQTEIATIRRLATVRVAGMTTPVDVHQLVIPSEEHPALSSQQITQYQISWEAFAAGQWDEAYRLLHELPVWDRPKDVLLRIILQHNRVPPPDWDGILEFPK